MGLNVLYLAWRYLAYHRFKTTILVGSITLILYLPFGLRVLVEQGSVRLNSRADSTPLLVGAQGSPLQLTLNTLYFGTDHPTPVRYEEVARVAESELARPIPMYVRFQSRGQPIVGTTLDYFDFRALRITTGRQMAMLGECVAGARAARALGVGPGDAVVSSPESAFDLAGVYPLKMRVAGVLEFSDSADDDAVFVDVKTAWVIQGLGHGHQDLSKPEARAGVLKRKGQEIIANAAVVQYNEITGENAGDVHFHGEMAGYPITAIIAVPRDDKASALFQGRYLGGDEDVQVLNPRDVVAELLETILTIESYVVAGVAIVGVATLAVTTLVFLLSLRLRQREIETMTKIGGARLAIGAVVASEVVGVLVASSVIAAGLILLTRAFAPLAARALIQIAAG